MISAIKQCAGKYKLISCMYDVVKYCEYGIKLTFVLFRCFIPSISLNVAVSFIHDFLLRSNVLLCLCKRLERLLENFFILYYIQWLVVPKHFSPGGFYDPST